MNPQPNPKPKASLGKILLLGFALIMIIFFIINKVQDYQYIKRHEPSLPTEMPGEEAPFYFEPTGLSAEEMLTLANFFLPEKHPMVSQEESDSFQHDPYAKAEDLGIQPQYDFQYCLAQTQHIEAALIENESGKITGFALRIPVTVYNEGSDEIALLQECAYRLHYALFSPGKKASWAGKQKYKELWIPVDADAPFMTAPPPPAEPYRSFDYRNMVWGLSERASVDSSRYCLESLAPYLSISIESQKTAYSFSD